MPRAPTFADYADALAALFAARRFGVKLDLEPLRRVLAALGHPEQSLGVIVHIGGTNGKGSTVAMVAGMARACGLRVAQYTSPHLVTVRERIVVDGAYISEAQFMAALARVHGAGGGGLTFFEQVTAIALLHIASQSPDLTILEVGLGGRGDATSVIADQAAVSAVTGVALDHMQILGDTIEKIAYEKAGIFAAGGHAVIGASGKAEALPVLAQLARQQGVADMVMVGDRERMMLPTTLALPGPHQRHNAATAVAIANILAAGALPALRAGIDANRQWGALANPAWIHHPGRYERCQWRGAHVILDGAHNPDGAQALAASLRADHEILANAPKVLVFAASADKDVAAMTAPLCAWATHVVATAFANERALNAETLGRAIGADRVATTISEALALAIALAGSDGTIVIAGSLMAIGEARAQLLGLAADPIAMTDPMPHGKTP